MEQQKQLQEYIYGQLQSGVNPNEIEQQLRGAGWDEVSIKQAFNAVGQSITLQPQQQATPAQAVTSEQNTQQQPQTNSVSPVSNTETDSQISQQPTQNSAHSNDTAQASVVFSPQGKKRGRIKTSWLLLKQSFKVLRINKQLIRYPLLSSVVVLVLSAIFIGIGIMGGDLFYYESAPLSSSSEIELTGPGVALVALMYVAVSFVTYLFSTGLAAHTLDIFRGSSKEYGHYMKVAWSKKIQILLFSIITVTVGFILRTLERNRLLGFIVSKVLGVLWAFANLFTIPIIAETDAQAISAIKQSGKLFVSRWGENIAARVSFAGIAFLIYFVLLIPIIFLAGLLSSFVPGVGGFIMFLMLFVGSLLIFATIETAASSILSTALYYYARYEQVPAAFSPELLNSSFIAKKKRK